MGNTAAGKALITRLGAVSVLADSKLSVVAFEMNGDIYPSINGKIIAREGLDIFAKKLGMQAEKVSNKRLEEECKKFLRAHPAPVDPEVAREAEFLEEAAKQVDSVERKGRELLFVAADDKGRHCEAIYNKSDGFAPVQRREMGMGPLGRNRFLARKLNDWAEAWKKDHTNS